MSVANVMKIAEGEVGYSRWNDSQPGTKYGRWYAQLTGSSYYGTNGVPYCAMFVTWVLYQANEQAACPGIPGAYCPWILTAGKNAGMMVATKNAKEGDVVLFDWEGDKVADHIGFVKTNNGSRLRIVVEGNTNNGAVAYRDRPYSSIIGVIRPNYGSIAPSGTGTSTPTSLAVDGYWGTNTTRALQKRLGTEQDGVISSQYEGDMSLYNRGGLQSSSWRWLNKTTTGSDVIRALQRHLNSKVNAGLNVDGFFGVKSCKALQKYLGTTQDGYVSAPSDVVKELQRRLNDGTF